MATCDPAPAIRQAAASLGGLLLLASALSLPAAGQDVRPGPIYVTSQEGAEARCDLIDSELYPDLPDRFRGLAGIRPAGAERVTLQGASTWNLSLSGFPEEAEDAFQMAANIWAGRLSSPIVIQVDAEFVDLGNSNLLGGGGPAVLVTGFPGAAPDTFYPVALANSLAAADLQPGQPDIRVSINSSFSAWYFGTDANPGFQEVDLVSVVLHELGHGLGFSDSFDVAGGNVGSWGFGGRAVIFDRFVEDGVGGNLVDTVLYPNPSMALGNALTSGTLFFDAASTSGARLFSPSVFQSGSSVAHLDESTYGQGSTNALMTPSLSTGEAQHDPGPVTGNIFQDLGWTWFGQAANHAPVADAGPSQQVDEQEIVTLDGSGSFDPDGDPLDFSWNQIAGPAVSFDTDAVAPSFQAPQVSEDRLLAFVLTVNDGSAMDSDSVNVTVRDQNLNLPPQARAGPDQNVNEGQLVTLDGSDSFDPDGDPLDFSWSQIAGPAVSFDTDAVAPFFQAPDVSEDRLLIFALTVDDGFTTDTDTVSVTVRNLTVNLPPQARAGPDQNVNEGQLVTLDGSDSFDPDGDPLGFVWTQLAGPLVTLSNAGTAQASFTAPTVSGESVLRFRLSVSDGQFSHSDTVDVRVREAEPASFDLHFAQFAFGGGLSSELCLLAGSAVATTEARVTFTEDTGAPWLVGLNGEAADSRFDISIPAGGAVRLQAPAEGPLEKGSVSVSSAQPLDGLVLFTGPFGLAGVPPGFPISGGFRMLVQIDRDRMVNTGLSIANLAENATTLEISLLGLDGSLAANADPDQELLEIPGNGQQSLFVTDLRFSPPVDLARFLGILRVTGPDPVAAVAMQTEPQEFATLTVSATGSTTPSGFAPGSLLTFPHFADGAGVSTQVSLLRLSTTSDADAVLMARAEQGEALAVRLQGGGMTPFEDRVPANGARVYHTSGQGDLVAGSLTVQSDQPLSGVALFGGEFGLAGVPPGQTMESGFRTLVQIDNGAGINTGVAIVNLENEPVMIEPRLFGEEGGVAGELATDQRIVIPASGQLRFFVTDFAWTPPVGPHFFGILEIRSSGRVAATAIQTRPRQFAALPVAPLP